MCLSKRVSTESMYFIDVCANTYIIEYSTLGTPYNGTKGNTLFSVRLVGPRYTGCIEVHDLYAFDTRSHTLSGASVTFSSVRTS